jgi:hypothetical protein
MFVVKLFSFLLDITPVVGGFKMLIEAFKGKEMSGTILVGNARLMQFLFAVISLVLDFSTGAGGSLARGTLRIVTLGFSKKLVEKAVEKKLAEGFLKKGLMGAARMSGKGVMRTGFIKAGIVVGKISESRVGEMAVNYAERKLRKTAKNVASDFAGARISTKKREEFRKKYGGWLSRDETIQAQKDTKNHKDEHDIELEKGLKQVYNDTTLRGALVTGARYSPRGSKLQTSLRNAGYEVGQQEKSSFIKRKAIQYGTNFAKKRALDKYNSYMKQKAENRDTILAEQRLNKGLQNSQYNNGNII